MRATMHKLAVRSPGQRQRRPSNEPIRRLWDTAHQHIALRLPEVPQSGFNIPPVGNLAPYHRLDSPLEEEPRMDEPAT